MREIVLDTETTGLDPFQGHRLVEIGCVELVNGIPSGQTFHRYLNPERSMPEEAFAIHGLADGFLKDKPLFAEIVDELIDFLGYAPLVIHNAGFDIGFLNAPPTPTLSFLGFDGEPSFTDVKVEHKLIPLKQELSNREKEILLMIMNGMVNKQIAERLNITKETVDKHRKNMLAKTDCKHSGELITKAIKNGWV